MSVSILLRTLKWPCSWMNLRDGLGGSSEAQILKGDLFPEIQTSLRGFLTLAKSSYLINYIHSFSNICYTTFLCKFSARFC